jgi:crossover junction endodeoxyribonuclease RuvC
MASAHPLGLRILGIDPGLNVTGYSVLEVGPRGPVICEAGVIRGAEGRGSNEMADRLLTLYGGVVEVIEQYRPQALACEQLFAHYEHPRTAILMGHARGCYLLAAAQNKIPTFSYGAAQVKKTITGNGRASKEQMQHAILCELGLAVLPEPHDVADALAVALCHYYAQPEPREEAG